MNMDIMQQNFNLIVLYLIKETKSTLVHLCINEQNQMLVSFSPKTNFKEDFSTDLSFEWHLYKCHYKQLEDNTIKVTNCAIIQNYTNNQNERTECFIQIIGELIYKTEIKQFDKIYQLIHYIYGNDQHQYNWYILTKIYLIVVLKIVNFPPKFKFSKTEAKILTKKYDIIKEDMNFNNLKSVLLKYYVYLERYGVELYNLNKLI